MPRSYLNKRLAKSTVLSATNKEWLRRVLNAGGQRPSARTFALNDVFITALNNAGLRSSMMCVNLFATDSIQAAYTPLIADQGLNSWSSPGSGGSVSDLTVNGVTANGGGVRFLDSGVLPGLFMNSGTGHGSVYVSVDDTTTGQEEFGTDDGTGLNDFRLNCHWTDLHTYGYAYQQSALFDSGARAGSIAGYYCMSRSTTTRADVFFANSTTAHASIANLTGAETHTPSTTHTMYVLATNNNGAALNQSKKRISAFTCGLGLTAAQSVLLFNAVQNFRTALGGGYS